MKATITNKLEQLIIKDGLIYRMNKLTETEEIYYNNIELFHQLKKLYDEIDSIKFCKWCKNEIKEEEEMHNFCSHLCKFDYYGE